MKLVFKTFGWLIVAVTALTSLLAASSRVGVAASGQAATTVQQLEDPVRSIMKTDEIAPYKISYDVSLRRRASKQELEKIARSIWKSGYERTFIGYFVDGVDRDLGYWATTHWEGAVVDVSIAGLTQEAADKLKDAALKPSSATMLDGRPLVGRWLIPNQFGGTVEIYRKGKDATIKHTFPDGSGSPEQCRVRKHRAGEAYYRVDPSGDFWVVTKSDELQAWDGEGRITSMTGSRVE